MRLHTILTRGGFIRAACSRGNIVALSWTRAVVSAALVSGLLVAVPLAAAVPVAATAQSTDASSAPDEATALGLASEFDHAVTVDSATTETELVQAQPDGTMQLLENSQPVRVQQGSDWVPVDSTLTSVDGTLQPRAAAVPVRFSAGGVGPLVQVQADSGDWLSETWTAGTLPAPRVSGSSATYADVYPGVDLQLTATPSGVADVLVIKDAAAAANPALSHVTFGINDGSMTTSATPGGTTLVKDATGTTQLSASTASWWDSSAADASASGPGDTGSAIPLAATVSSTQVTLNAAAPAASPDVAYPLYIDPPWTAGRNSWGMVDSAYPTVAYWKDNGVADGYQHVGYVGAAQNPYPDDGLAHSAYSYWQMDTSPVAGKRIVNATFTTTEVHAFSCTPSPVQLWTSEPLTPSSTWSNRPALRILSDTQTVAYGYDASCAAQGQVNFDASAAVQRTASAAAPISATLNLALAAQNMNDSSGWKKFLPGAALKINYLSYPTVPSNRSMGPCWAVCGLGAIVNSRAPTFHATAGDADGGVSLNYYFSVCAGTPSSVGDCHGPFSAQYPAGSPASYTLPSTTGIPLTEGNWVWRVWACRTDTGYTDVCSDPTTWFNFVVDVTAPTAPTITSTDLDLTNNSRQGTEHVPAAIQLSSTPSDHAWAYAYTSGTVGERLASASCPRTSGGVAIVCASASSPTSGTVVPEDALNTLYAYSFDKAGNRSPVRAASFSVFESTASSADHLWLADRDDYLSAATQLDDVSQGASPLALSLTDVSWRSKDSSDPAGTFDTSLPEEHDAALYFNGTSTQAVSATGSSTPVTTLDGTHSMSIAAWVKPDSSELDSGSLGVRVIASQDSPSGHSAFVLQRNNGKWQMCAPKVDATTDCATSQYVYPDDGRAVDGAWVLVVGTWNSVSKTLGVYAYNYDLFGEKAPNGNPPPIDEPPTETSHTSIAAASQGALVLGRDESTSGNRWRGEIAGIELYNGIVLSQDSRRSLWASPAVPASIGSN